MVNSKILKKSFYKAFKAYNVKPRLKEYGINEDKYIKRILSSDRIVKYINENMLYIPSFEFSVSCIVPERGNFPLLCNKKACRLGTFIASEYPQESFWCSEALSTYITENGKIFLAKEKSFYLNFNSKKYSTVVGTVNYTFRKKTSGNCFSLSLLNPLMNKKYQELWLE